MVAQVVDRSTERIVASLDHSLPNVPKEAVRESIVIIIMFFILIIIVFVILIIITVLIILMTR